MKITQIVPYFYPAWAYGGIPRLVYELAREQARMGHTVNVITTDALDHTRRHPESGCEVSMEGMTISYLPNISNRRAYYSQLFAPIGMKKALEKLALESDVIHIHGHRHLLEVAAIRFANKHGIPYVITANGSTPQIERKQGVKRFLDMVALDRMLQKASALIAVSRAEIPQYAEKCVAPEKIHVIPNGLDVEAFDNIPVKGSFRKEWGLDDTPIILYLGKITPRKGLIPLVQAADIIRKRRPVLLVIAGNDMGFVHRVKQEVSKLKMGKHTLFTGLVQGAQKLAVYADADVTIYPSELEIFGLSPFESLLCGTPVVVSDDSGCGEIIGGAGIGEIVPYGKPDLLAAAIEKVLDRPDKSADVVEKGRAFIRANLTWPKIAEDTINLYMKVIKK